MIAVLNGSEFHYRSMVHWNVKQVGQNTDRVKPSCHAKARIALFASSFRGKIGSAELSFSHFAKLQ